MFKIKVFNLFVLVNVLLIAMGIAFYSANNIDEELLYVSADVQSVQVDYSNAPLYDPRTFNDDEDDNTFNYLPSVKNQGQLGLCWAYAIAGAIEIDMWKNWGEEVDIAEKYLAYFAKNGYDTALGSGTYGDGLKSVSGGNVDYNEIFNGGGAFEYTLSSLIAGWGLFEQDYIDNTTSLNMYLQNLSAVNWEDYRFGDVASVVGSEHYYGSEDIGVIKDKIVENGSVLTNVQMEDLNAGLYNSNTYAYYASSEMFSATDHMIEIVGWNDSFSASNFVVRPSGDGAWLVRNSWGTSWGDAGYAWVSYYDVGVLTSGYDSIEIETYDDRQVLYQYECGTDSMASMAGSAITYGSIYRNETQYQQEITSIGLQIWTGEEGGCEQICEIKIYKSEQNMATPTSGALMCTISKTFTNSGFYKINLNEALNIESGESFSIVVKNDSSQKGYACFEGAGNEAYGIYRSSLSGQSFLKTGNIWIDTSEEISGYCYNNAGIKVYAVRTECIEHSYNESGYTESTCISYAKTIYTCSVCGRIKEEIDVAGGYASHDYNAIGHTDGNCCNYGFTTYECKVCNDIKTEDDLIFGEHSFVSNYHVEGTCKTKGYIVEQYCSICKLENGLKTLDEEFGSHSYKDKTTIYGDCKHLTRTIRQCDVCGDEVVIENVELGYGHHKFSNIVEQDGGMLISCSVEGCDESFVFYETTDCVVIENVEKEQLSFCWGDIPGKLSSNILVKLKNGIIKLDLNSRQLEQSVHIGLKLKTLANEDVVSQYNIDSAYADATFYQIEINVDGVLLSEVKVEIYCEVEGKNAVQFYNPIINGEDKYFEGEITPNGVCGSFDEGVYAFRLLFREENTGAKFEFKWEYVIVILVIISIILMGEFTARSRKKSDELE